MSQEGDVKLIQIDDGGEISVSAGVVDMDGGLESSVYLSLFGGNEDDDGLDGNVKTWWGNLGEPTPNLRQISETQNLIKSLPLTSGNLKRVEAAANKDLSWMVPAGAASSVEAFANVEGLNRLRIRVIIEAVGETSEFVFYQNWKAAI